MTIYVDDAKLPFGRMIMCHMVSRNEAELHAFAAAIGIRRKWFHRGHYNICQAKRCDAISRGAVPTTQRQAAIIRRALDDRRLP